jgi:hypothetical protein
MPADPVDVRGEQGRCGIDGGQVLSQSERKKRKVKVEAGKRDVCLGGKSSPPPLLLLLQWQVQVECIWEEGKTARVEESGWKRKSCEYHLSTPRRYHLPSSS